ncbi:MAG TPA: ABC transporter permease, partial [Candidatus Angelobacter sp.]|nr:ABC transporter permease [Candidatus Angelobacter sp.]
LQDIRFGLRMFAKSPTTTAILVVTLALGIGANTAVFTLINGVMLRSLPVSHPEQIYFFGADTSSGTHSGNALTGAVSLYSYPAFEQFRERNRSAFDGLTAMSSPQNDIHVSDPASNERPRRFLGSLVDGDFFRVLGVNALVGRMLVAEDDRPDSPAVTVISYRYWNQSLGRDSQIAGKKLLINGASFTVVGVTPPEFYGVKLNNPPDFWFPLNQQSFLIESTAANRNGSSNWLKAEDVQWLDVLGRLKPEANPRATSSVLSSQLQQMISGLEGSSPSPERAQQIRETRVELVPGSRGLSRLRARFSPRFEILAVLVILVLMIACLNTANLLLARATAREPEIAVRLAMGAGRRRVVRQLLTESMLLAGLGGLAGFALAVWVTKLLSTMVLGNASTLPFFSFKPDLQVFFFTFSVALITGALFGLAPAYRGTRVDLNRVLKDEFRSGGSFRASILTPAKLLVSTQVVVSLTLLLMAGLFVGSLRKLEQQDLGFVPERVLICRLDLEAAGYKAAQLPELYSRLIDRVLALPGVRSAALADAGALSGSNSTSNISIEGYTPKPKENMTIQHRHVTGDYVATNGMILLVGRDISGDDRQETPHVAVVNQAFVERYFPGQDPIGHSFGLGAPFNPATGMKIVGVVKNSKYNSLDEKTLPLAFIPLLQDPFDNQGEKKDRPYQYGNELNLRAAGDPSVLSEALRHAVADVDRNIAVSSIRTLIERINDSTHDARAIAQLSGFFAAFALLLSAIGLYGVMAYSVSRRTREIGIRIAIGAQRRTVLRMVMRESLLVVVIGVAVGIPAALGMGHFISSQLFGLSPRDPLTLAAAAVLLLTASAIASYLPARRAAEIDPMVALRYE